jgi:hypothetical protein
MSVAVARNSDAKTLAQIERDPDPTAYHVNTFRPSSSTSGFFITRHSVVH